MDKNLIKYDIEPHQKLMIRLQLLKMESKRAQESKAQAALELQRFHGVLTELASKIDVERRSRQTRFALDTTSERTEEDGFTSNDWIWPELRITRAWEKWLLQFDLDGFKSDFVHKKTKPQIAFMLGGGVGDILKATTLFSALKIRFSADIHAFIDNSVAKEVLRDNPFITSINIISVNPYKFASDVIQRLPLFDLIVTARYAVNYVLPPQSRLDFPEIKDLVSDSINKSFPYRIYYNFNDTWPIFNNGLGRDMISDDWKVIDMLGITSNLNIDRTSPIPFTPSKDSLAIIEPHRRRPYITIHHGFDLNHLPSKTLSTTYGSTKNISTELWGEIVREVSELGLDVVQLGTTSEETLPGVRYVYNGQTSFSETAMLIKNAVCHIDTEGGLVHLARAMHTRSIVMFGPTPVEVFGYHENINFEPSGCKACWYSTQNWIVQCPRQTKGPECMTEHRSENVLEAVRRIILERGNLSLDLINRVRDDDESNASISNPIDALIASLKLTDRRLLVVADSSSDVQAKRLAPYGFDVEFVVTDPKESWAITETSTHIASTPIVASPYNLPQESGSVDVVIASLQAWRDDERGQVLRELCRVLRNEGIILGVPSPSDQPFDLLSMLDEGGFPIGERGALTAAHPNYFLLRFRRSFGQAGKLSSHSDNQAQQSGVARSTPDGGLLARLERDIQAEKDRIRLDLTEVYDLVTAREDVDDKIWAAKDTIGRLRSGLDGWIEFTSIVLDIDAMALLAENWQIPEPWGVWGAGARHTLLLPAPRGIADGQSLEVQIAFNLLPLQDQPTRFVTVRIGATEITKIACTEYENKETFFIRSEDFLANGGARLEFDVEKGIVPAAIMANSIDYRSLGLGLVRLRYKVV